MRGWWQSKHMQCVFALLGKYHFNEFVQVCKIAATLSSTNNSKLVERMLKLASHFLSNDGLFTNIRHLAFCWYSSAELSPLDWRMESTSFPLTSQARKKRTSKITDPYILGLILAVLSLLLLWIITFYSSSWHRTKTANVQSEDRTGWNERISFFRMI